MALLVFLNRNVGESGGGTPDRGDVIAVLPDGQSPGQKITAAAGFHQIQVAGPVTDWAHLLEPVLERVDRGDGELITIATQARANILDEAQLSAAEQNRLTQGVLNLAVSKTEEITKSKTRPGRADIKGRISIEGGPKDQRG